MPGSCRFRALGWESLENRSVLSPVGGPVLAPPGVPVPRTDAYARMRLASNLQQAAHGGARVVLLGDSILDYWTSVGASSWTTQIGPRGTADFGVKGNTTGNLLAQINAGELVGAPRVIVLMIGVNDLLDAASASQTAQGIAADVAAVRTHSPQSQVLLVGLLPLNLASDPYVNREVAAVNAQIWRLDDGTHVHYVNISNLFTSPGGAPNGAMYLDAVHLSAPGYSAWAQTLGPELDALNVLSAANPGLTLTPPPAPPPTLPPGGRRRA